MPRKEEVKGEALVAPLVIPDKTDLGLEAEMKDPTPEGKRIEGSTDLDPEVVVEVASEVATDKVIAEEEVIMTEMAASETIVGPVVDIESATEIGIGIEKAGKRGRLSTAKRTRLLSQKGSEDCATNSPARASTN